MEIIIEGWRAGGQEGREANRLSVSELPALSDEQKKVAKRMGISEEDYARTTVAGKRNQERLFEKTKRFAAILNDKLVSKLEGARIERVWLVTIERENRIEISANGRKLVFRVPEEMVDDFIEGGSADAGRLIERNLEIAIAVQAA